MDVADEGVAPGVLRIHAALVDLDAGIRGAEVLVLHDAGQQLIGIRVLRRAALPHVDAAGGHVEEVVDDAGADEEVSRRVVVAAPGIAGAVGKDFELPGRGGCSWGLRPRRRCASLWARTLSFAPGVKDLSYYRPTAADPRVELEALALRLAGAADFAVGEDAVRHVKPAVGAPGEAIDQLVRVLATKAGQDHAPFVGHVVVVAVLEVQEVRLLADINAIVATDDGAG